MDAFTSPLGEEMSSFMELIALSVVDHAAYRRDLVAFDAFLTADGSSDKSFTPEQVSCWLDGYDIALSSKKGKLGHIRKLSDYLKTLGIKTTLPELPRSSSTFEPYVFTTDEMRQIFEAADDAVSLKPHSLVAAELPMLLRILYGCGLRAGEATALTWDDVNLEEGTLTIRKAKNNKQRIVPMSEGLTRVLGLYKAASCFAASEHGHLFKKENGTPSCPTTYHKIFNSILYDAGIKGDRTQAFSRGPCLHSLRHVFVLHSLLKAEAEGRNFMETVPFLSTYLGHEKLMETDKYLRARYDLYKTAHEKIEHYTEDIFPEVSQS
jgi:integrase